MSKCFCEFMTRLEGDEEFKKLYDTDPKAAMDEYRLTHEEREAMKSGDQERIKKLLGGDYPLPKLIVA